MKKTIKLLMMVGLLILISGCVGPYYTNRQQYNNGRWVGLAGNHDIAQMDRQQFALERDKMALQKLQAQPVMTGTMTSTGVVANSNAVASAPGTAPAGYEGIVANMSSYNRYTFRIRGPESRSFYLGPGERVTDHLLPGTYMGTVYQGGSQIGQPHVFTVGVQDKVFQNQKCHWFLFAEW